jgi:hypothetical protein
LTIPISDDEAIELARPLREHAGDATSIADRVDRALVIGTDLIATSHSEAQAVLAVFDAWIGETPPSARLLETRSSLAEMVKTA